jgi:tetratricopeptide (TPR) repeat protein
VADRDLEQAEELLKKQRYAEAIERFRALLSSDPDNAELRARCGEAYRLAGNTDRAFHHFNKAAALHARGGDAMKALRLLHAANAVSPGEPDILFRMAECLKAIGDHASLELMLRQLVGIARGSGDRRRLWALEELAARHPEDLDIAVRRAEALTEAGRVQEAVHAWKQVSARLDQRGIDFVPMIQRAAAIAPDRADVGVDLASVLLANRRPREALVLLVPFYEKFPDDIGILEVLLGALETLGATDKIIPARIELIKARAKRGLREHAIREIAILLESAPDDASALEVSAHAYSAFGDTAEALSLWKRLMNLYDRTGRRFERDRAVLTVLKANPDDEEALTLGSRALREAARVEEAVVLETRLAALRKLRAKNVVPTKSTSAPSMLPPPAIADAPRPKRAFADFDATIPPDEMPGEPAFNPLDHGDELSEPSIESMPIALSPYDGAEISLGVVAIRAPSIARESPRLSDETKELSRPEPTTPGEDLRRTHIPDTAWPRPATRPRSEPPALSTRPRTPPRVVIEDAPTRPYEAEELTYAPDMALASDHTVDEDGPGTYSDADDAGTLFGVLGEGLPLGVDLAVELPPEDPTGTEETTSRMPDPFFDEPDASYDDRTELALEAELRAGTRRGVDAQPSSERSSPGGGGAGRSPAPAEFDVEGVRPTLRSKLFTESSRPKKA